MSETINHRGIIEKIENGVIFVRIIQRSACSGCHAQSICSTSEAKEKIVEVPDLTGEFRVNQAVMICGESSMGMQAVLLAFVLPLLLVVFAIVVGTNFEWEETTSGLISLLFLAPYYGILYLFRDKLKRQFVFTLKKLN